VSLTRDGQPVPEPSAPSAAKILKATYGVPGDAQRTREVRAKLQALIDLSGDSFQVGQLAAGDDPAYGVVKTLAAEYTVNGRSFTIGGQDPDTISLQTPIGAHVPAAEVRSDDAGRLSLAASQPGNYELTTADGKTLHASVASIPAPFVISGPWDVRFPPKWGAPAQIRMDELASLSESADPGVKYFSGTATYLKTFNWDAASPPAGRKSEEWLDLGEVQVMAQVTLNGHNLGILWKPPFKLDVTEALQAGQNQLEIRVADLWPNRMIGDSALPLAQRLTWSTYEPFTKDTPLLKSGLLGPVTLHTTETVPLP
jgi:hypothetical protein